MILDSHTVVFNLDLKQTAFDEVSSDNYNLTSPLRKLDCIAQYVLNYLLQSFFVAPNICRDPLVNLFHLDLLASCLSIV